MKFAQKFGVLALISPATARANPRAFRHATVEAAAPPWAPPVTAAAAGRRGRAFGLRICETPVFQQRRNGRS